MRAQLLAEGPTRRERGIGSGRSVHGERGQRSHEKADADDDCKDLHGASEIRFD